MLINFIHTNNIINRNPESQKYIKTNHTLKSPTTKHQTYPTPTQKFPKKKTHTIITLGIKHIQNQFSTQKRIPQRNQVESQTQNPQQSIHTHKQLYKKINGEIEGEPRNFFWGTRAPWRTRREARWPTAEEDERCSSEEGPSRAGNGEEGEREDVRPREVGAGPTEPTHIEWSAEWHHYEWGKKGRGCVFYS